MTAQQIDEMPAGREIDLLIAEQLFGWRDLEWREEKNIHELGVRTWSPTGYYGKGPQHECYLTHRYSTKIEDAWLVVEKLRERISDEILLGYGCDKAIGLWACAFGIYEVTADTAPLAICRAALKAINNAS